MGNLGRKVLQRTVRMKVTGFDGRERNFNFSKYFVRADDRKARSNLHKRARKILQEFFPRDRLYEEVPLPGSSQGSVRNILRADFFLPSHFLIVEVHGRQHYEFVRHFHGNKLDFFRSQKRDRDKAEWCEINPVNLVILKYSDTDDEWKKQLAACS